MSSTFRTRALAAGAIALAGGAAIAGIGAASPGSGPDLAPVATASPRAAGAVAPDRLSAGLQQVTWAQGATALENPAGIVTHYGYKNDVPSADDAALPQALPTPASATEAQKTEPDKNTYLALRHGVSGPDAHYDYGTHVLFQGHEGAAHDASDRPLGYLTRINLDADAAHRVTLMATEDADGRPLVDDRRVDVGAVRAAPAPDDGEPGRADLRGHGGLPVDRQRRVGRARPRRLRGHPGRLRREHLDRRGRRRRREGDDEGQAPQQLRLPLRPAAPGRPRAREAPGAPGAQRVRAADHVRVAGGRRRARPGAAPQLRALAADPLGDRPRHRRRRHRALRRDREDHRGQHEPSAARGARRRRPRDGPQPFAHGRSGYASPRAARAGRGARLRPAAAGPTGRARAAARAGTPRGR